MPGILNKFSELKKKAERYRRDTAWQLGGGRSFMQKARGTRILLYHGICESDPHLFNTLFLTKAAFEEQLQLYTKYCQVISLDDFYKGAADPDRLSVCLSFDDGFANNHKYVLPLLEKYKVPATFFITAIRDAGYDILWNDLLCLAYQLGPARFSFRDDEFIKTATGKYWSVTTGELLADNLRNSDFETKAELVKKFEHLKGYADEDYWLQLTTTQIREMAASPWVTIGSHSYHHNDLAKVRAREVYKDLLNSKLFLELITGKPVRSLAFPYGSYNSETIQAAANAGYSQLLATDFLQVTDNTDPLLRERLTVNPFISSINQLYANVSGTY
jgi:peptidoglycan/xylan/chitin deacetylase (PgdA/CDA1 family)